MQKHKKVITINSAFQRQKIGSKILPWILKIKKYCYIRLSVNVNEIKNRHNNEKSIKKKIFSLR